MSFLSPFHGPNAGFVLDLYDRYQQDPDSLDEQTRAFFQTWTPEQEPGESGAAPTAPIPAVDAPRAGAALPLDTGKIVAGARLGRLVRELGHLGARIDPLGSEPPGDPEMEIAHQGLEEAELALLPPSVIGGPCAKSAGNALEALHCLRAVYCGSVGYEDDHIQIAEERDWLREAIESRRFFRNFGASEKRALLERLTEVETFEQFLGKTFPGAKRFSIEGTDMLVPILDTLIHCAAESGTREIVMGMAHRGRLNVLAHVLNKPYQTILSEFAAAESEAALPAVSGTGSLGYTGDVKYHLGARRAYTGEGIPEMPITLAPNPSHLEFVDPAVLGRARAAQEQRGDKGYPIQNLSASLSILIHGDAAFPGQGIVAETLNLGQLAGYRVGGTIHIIANNQIGFTTDPRDVRSTLYASDLAKGFEMPIVHVNADDPHACIAVARMACGYRERFGKDFLIDLVGYRRLGHNELDEPAYTQPRMYEIIRAHPTVRALWAERLEQEGIVKPGEAEALVAQVTERLQNARKAEPTQPTLRDTLRSETAASPNGQGRPVDTSVPAERLRQLNEALHAVPEGFTANPTLERRFLARRRGALAEEVPAIEWAHAEALAFAGILADGTPLRFTGQDVERGTFTQRHLVLHDPKVGKRWCPLQALPEARASFALHNSPLSENAALGFEYGYSIHARDTLVLWEAQFGDFVNGAQVIIDQFIAAGNAKWRQAPSLVLLLPHGYEGQGPEHSSGRLERFLQLCAADNLRVANCTTPAQYFHLLRRQAQLLQSDPRPLVVMTPKSLLRHPRVVSSIGDLAEGGFRPVLDDERTDRPAPEITRVVLCSGKVYTDLLYEAPRYTPRPAYTEARNVAIARVEELYPFPAESLRKLIAGYPNRQEIVWLQEEPRNMGAWTFVEPHLRALLPPGVSLRYIGRPEEASPAEGSASLHGREQNRIINAAFEVGGGDVTDAVGVAPAPTGKKSARASEVTHAR